MTAPPSPAISVIVATHNRRDTLRRCLEALCRQTVDPAGVEVIVADDGSTDGTAELVEAFATPFSLRVLRLSKGGKSASLNAGIEAARADVCLFLDDDIVASPDLIAAHLEGHRRPEPTLGIGVLVQKPPLDGDPYARAFAQIWNERYHERLGREADWADCYGANFSAPRAALLETEGFAVDLPAVEDLELAFRLCSAGCVAHLLPDARAVHDDQKPGGRILADEERFGAWCADFVRAHPGARLRLLGWVSELSIQEVMVRRLLLALRIPTPALAWPGRLLPGRMGSVWFAFLSRHAFWRGVRHSMSRAEWLQATRGVPVLMYHAFTTGGASDRFIMPRRSFARQMRLLALLRYRPVAAEELALALREGRNLPRRAVVITIDDGYRDNAEIAAGVLRRRGYAATVFLVSGRLGARNDWDGEGAVAGRPLLSHPEAKRLGEEGGIGFGAHTRTHASLPGLSDAAAAAEIGGSRDDLERALGTKVRTFAYPYGRHDARVARLAEKAGFRGAFTTYARRVRIGDDPLLIPRIEIHGQDSVPRFLRKLWFGGG